MKIRVDIDNKLESDEIIIKCKEKTDLVNKLEQFAKSLDYVNLVFYKKGQEYYLDLNEVIFFETYDNGISAHTINDIYYVKYKLYELEKILPNKYVRISKSTIVNISHIYSLNRNIATSSVIEFNKTYKKVFVSRFYIKNLKQKLKERS